MCGVEAGLNCKLISKCGSLHHFEVDFAIGLEWEMQIGV